MLIDDLRAREFARLDETDHAYLDYTGAALYPMSLIESHASMLRDAVLGNPHSQNQASLASSALLAEARAHVRRFFNAGDYEVCFTANASGAMRLVAEGFPFAADRPFVLTADNHNSINGIREYARRAGAPVHYLEMDDELRVAPSGIPGHRGLFAFPAQSNFSGVKHSLGLIETAQSKGHAVLLDAAAFAPTSTLDLRRARPEFVALSFYKMFGFPTGIGALLARRDALTMLTRPWFAGGTVDHVTVRPVSHVFRDGAEAFEDGTVNFLGVGALPAGMRWLEAHGVDRIGAHAAGLAQRLANELAALRHRDGRAMVQMYGPRDWSARGAVVTFNVLDERGSLIGHETVEAIARDARVSVRGGCFCNPGAAEAAGLGFGAGVPGAVRASLGAASDGRDVQRLVQLIEAVAARRPACCARAREPHVSANRTFAVTAPELDRTARTLH